MKIYFINPNGGFSIYYKECSNKLDIKSLKSINIGYNDVYEMRSEHLSKPWFSDNVEDLKKILEERKKELIKERLKKVSEITKIHIKDIRPYKHNSIDSPF
jgi:hypothetical protein